MTGASRGLARELGPSGVTVNNIQPGPEGAFITVAGIMIDGGFDA